MIQIPDLIKERKRRNPIARPGLPKSHNPVVEIIFYPRAAQKQRRGINRKMHGVLSCYTATTTPVRQKNEGAHCSRTPSRI